jgi:hypothetical protein
MHILVPDISVAEKLARSVMVYAFLPVAFRLCGKPSASSGPTGWSSTRRPCSSRTAVS